MKLYPPDPCAPAIHMPPPTAETVRERLMEKLLRECLPDLEYVENGTRTSAVRRNLIAQITHVTRES